MSVNHDELAESYRRYRTPDARISSSIWAHLEGAERVLNVGAGTGAYEPDNCDVVAVEPSVQMTRLRRSFHAKVVRASAENLPFDDGAFDASMALLTIHHWSDIRRGLKEMLRVTSGNIVLFTWVGYGNDFWLEDYIAAMRGFDLKLFPNLRELEEMLGSVRVEPVEIPHDCTDGFMCAYWRRFRAYLDPAAQKAISTFSRVGAIEESLRNLEDDLASGEWDRKYGAFADQAEHGSGISVGGARQGDGPARCGRVSRPFGPAPLKAAAVIPGDSQLPAHRRQSG